MLKRALWMVTAAVALVGCAAPIETPRAGALPWLDDAFEAQPNLVTVGKDELFRLAPDLQARLKDANVDGMSNPRKLKHILTLIFGPDLRGFNYAAGHSTIASETWQRKRGDCLSLTVLTYSVARALRMNAQMQEVRVPVLFDRRGQVDVVNQHVNVLFRGGARQWPDEAEAHDTVIDFEPEFSSGKPGHPLTEEAILARYYNNLGAEHLVAGRRSLAYAHFKAAIQADAAYAASYGNLAVLYRETGRLREAEQLLVWAVKLSDPPDVPLHTLHEMLVAQGRTAEAERYAVAMRAARDRDPYYWVARGIDLLNQGDARRAIAALEHAREMSNGFDEVHRYLALAYWRAGEPLKARQELDVLVASGDDVGASKVRRKIKARTVEPPPPS
ncbi:tetratricopeptide repeat protein [Caenimonas aquaedulcis]|uniref:Tetratricopeptide repeat protein n=1 Tax=Caenimonas aquaedulcis TaxID=2793270 RepID=A0A931MFM1_9BURK|nr:tetratricopeptide repeat protein [Caenimonas aquaedulcis]MBG9387124.1 tetratricopeptide repeat protein [Caenimonas aquaedulcis]